MEGTWTVESNFSWEGFLWVWVRFFKRHAMGPRDGFLAVISWFCLPGQKTLFQLPWRVPKLRPELESTICLWSIGDQGRYFSSLEVLVLLCLWMIILCPFGSPWGPSYHEEKEESEKDKKDKSSKPTLLVSRREIEREIVAHHPLFLAIPRTLRVESLNKSLLYFDSHHK